LFCAASPFTGFAALHTDVNTQPDSLLFARQQHYDHRVVLLQQQQGFLPLQRYKGLSTINLVAEDLFSAALLDSCWGWYGDTDYMTVPKRPDYFTIAAITTQVSDYDIIYIHIGPHDGRITPQLINMVEMLPRKGRIVLVVYDDEEVAARIHHKGLFGAVIIAHSAVPEAVSAVVRGVFGGIPFRGTTASGEGLQTQQSRINYSPSPLTVVKTGHFHNIDSIIDDAIQKKVFPGCQIIAIHRGEVIFERAYGHHTGSAICEVVPTDIYDLASITKILTTTAALIQLDHSGVIDLNGRLGDYLTIARGTNKEHLKIRDILLHRARLQSWIPFYRALMKNGQPDTTVFRREPSFDFPVRVADSLWIRIGYHQIILNQILESPLRRNHQHLYSDLGMILLKYMIEEQTKLPFEEYLEEAVFNPLNLYSIGFHPRQHYSSDRIVPTENDDYFRHEMLHGYVHDQATAMLGGVAGHAGLFANARDVAVMMYTLATGGTYGGIQVFDPESINKFNRRPYSRLRRGLGFDKPEPSRSARPNVTRMASSSSFGHAGFTGTFAWADPEHELIYVFLSNRVHPTANNPYLTRMGIRIKIHEELYHAIQP